MGSEFPRSTYAPADDGLNPPSTQDEAQLQLFSNVDLSWIKYDADEASKEKASAKYFDFLAVNAHRRQQLRHISLGPPDINRWSPIRILTPLAHQNLKSLVVTLVRTDGELPPPLPTNSTTAQSQNLKSTICWSCCRVAFTATAIFLCWLDLSWLKRLSMVVLPDDSIRPCGFVGALLEIIPEDLERPQLCIPHPSDPEENAELVSFLSSRRLKALRSSRLKTCSFS